MIKLIQLIASHPEPEVKIIACSIMSEATSDNKQVQEFVQKSGALNFTKLIENERIPRVKEAVFNALSSLIMGNNFESKRQFIIDFDGLNFLSNLVVC
jgi:hypothetical protein